MDNLYSSVYNYKGESLGPYLNTSSPFRSTTSCGINRTLKVRNNTNSNIHILVKNGEFEILEEAKHKIAGSVYSYDSGAIIKPFSMSLINTSTFSFYVACFVELDGNCIMLFEKLMNRSNDITITQSYLLSQLKEVSMDDYIKFLQKELQNTREGEKTKLSESGKNIINERTKYFKRDLVDFTRSRENLNSTFSLS